MKSVINKSFLVIEIMHHGQFIHKSFLSSPRSKLFTCMKTWFKPFSKTVHNDCHKNSDNLKRKTVLVRYSIEWAICTEFRAKM